MRQYTHAGDYLLHTEAPKNADIQEMYPKAKIKRFHGHNAFMAFEGNKEHFVSYWTYMATFATNSDTQRTIRIRYSYDTYSQSTTKQVEKWLYERVKSDVKRFGHTENTCYYFGCKVLRMLRQACDMGYENTPSYIVISYNAENLGTEATYERKARRGR